MNIYLIYNEPDEAQKVCKLLTDELGFSNCVYDIPIPNQLNNLWAVHIREDCYISIDVYNTIIIKSIFTLDNIIEF